MGIGEDESLGDAISVTIVATGFAVDQQSSITNTEVKKIIHTLEDEQKATYDFSEKTITKSSELDAPLSSKPEAKIIHVLEDEVEEDPTGLIPTTEFINNIEVVYDEIEIETVSDDDFIITNANPIVEEKEEEQESGLILMETLFDLPLNSYEEIKPETNEVRFDLSIDDVNEIEVKDATEIVADITETVEKRYVLEDFNATPTIAKSSHPNQQNQTIVEEDEELAFVVKTKPAIEVDDIETISEEISPLSLTISELEKTAELRRQKMKGFNYKFTDQVNKNIDEIEKQPAYKRLGVNLDEVNSDLSKSKTTLSTDANDDVQLRSNNSFLHDNVD